MANNCSNYIELYGGTVSLKPLATAFVELDNSTDEYECLHGSNYWKLMDFTYPKYGEGEEFDVYAEYGSKWFEFCLEEYDEESNYMRITGDSAWSPVIPLVEKLCIHYEIKSALIEYEESGSDFGGQTDFENGVIVRQREMSYNAWSWVISGDDYYLLKCWAERIIEEEESIFDFYINNKDLFKLFSSKDIRHLIEYVNEFKKLENE